MLNKTFGKLSDLNPYWENPDYLLVSGKELNEIIDIKYRDINLDKEEMKDLISGIKNPLTDLFINEIDWNDYVPRPLRDRLKSIKYRNFFETKDNVELFQSMKQPETKYLSCGDLNAFYKMFLQISNRIFSKFRFQFIVICKPSHMLIF